MRFALTEEQTALRKQARRFLSKASGSEQVRAAMASDLGYDPKVWKRVSAELGWPAILIPEAYGGFGFTFSELVPVFEEAGRALFCGPLLGSCVLGAGAFLVAGDEAQKHAYLPAIAAGESLAALAVAEPAGRWDAEGVVATAVADGGDYVLSGLKRFVLDGHIADVVVVAARAPDSEGPHGISLFAVPGDAPGLSRKRLATMDQTRCLADVRLDGVRVPAEARLGDEGEAWPLIEAVLDLGAVALALEQVGGADRCLEEAVEYAMVREQFGRPIGSFQAVKHICADMLLQVESARSAAWYAAWAAANAPGELHLAAPLAKGYASDAFFHCAGESIQVHGGIGFTWEHDAHLYFKRARSSQSLLGDATVQRELIAQRLGLGTGTLEDAAWT